MSIRRPSVRRATRSAIAPRESECKKRFPKGHELINAPWVGDLLEPVLSRKRRSSVKMRCVAKGQQPPNELAAKAPLFDHLIGVIEEMRGDGDAERFGGLEIYDELKFIRILHGQIGWFLSFEDAIHIC